MGFIAGKQWKGFGGKISGDEIEFPASLVSGRKADRVSRTKNVNVRNGEFPMGGASQVS